MSNHSATHGSIGKLNLQVRNDHHFDTTNGRPIQLIKTSGIIGTVYSIYYSAQQVIITTDYMYNNNNTEYMSSEPLNLLC